MKFKIYFLLILLISSFLVMPIISNIEIQVESAPFAPISYPEEELTQEVDTKFEAVVKVPKDWVKTIAFENPDNTIGVIIRRVIYEKDGDRVILDIWNSNNQSLEDNHKKLQGVFLSNKEKRKVNAKINGINTIVSSNLDDSEGNLQHLSAFFQTKKFIYRINYPITSEKGVEKFLTFVNKFKIRGNEKNEDYKIDQLELPKRKSVISFSLVNKVFAVDTCGGYSMSGNNFPCCASGGNCTWWAIYRRQDLKNKITWGNAGQDWISQATQANIPIHNDPIPGSIAVWNPNGPRSGHVAYVNSVANTNSFNISEMNCSGSSAPGPRDVWVQKNYSNYWQLTFLGFIGFGTNLIQNQTITNGTYIGNPFTIKPESRLIPTGGDIIVKVQ